MEDMTFVEAVAALIGKANYVPRIDPDAHEDSASRHANFSLPEPAENNRRVFSYLQKERCILPQIINHFIKCGDLYEDAAHHNAVFVGRDENAVPRFAHKRSTNTLIPDKKEDGTKRLNRWDVTGSDKHYGFKFVGPSNRVFVFEAPIDLMSFISLREITQPAGTWKKDSYLSLDGVSDLALGEFISGKKKDSEIKRIVFCLDSDDPGQEAAENLSKSWGKVYNTKIKSPAQGKDYNDMLKLMVKNAGSLL
jgi:hypothetical protein